MIEKIRAEGFQTRNDLNYFLTELKESEPWLYSYYAKMLQMISTQVAGAQKSLKELDKKGYKTGTLRFARDCDFCTFIYNQAGFYILDRKLQLSKIGKIHSIFHRHTQGDIKQVSVTKSKSGKWYCSIICHIDVEMPKINFAKSVGVDVGIKNFAYDSDGFATPNPLNLKKMLNPLARA